MLQQSLAAAAVLLFSWTFKQNETFHKNAFIVPSSYWMRIIYYRAAKSIFPRLTPSLCESITASPPLLVELKFDLEVCGNFVNKMEPRLELMNSIGSLRPAKHTLHKTLLT